MSLEKRRVALKSLLAGAMTPLIPACMTSPARPPKIGQNDFAPAIAYLQDLFAHEMQAQGLTGLSIAVVNDQQLTWTQGFGWADQSGGIPAGSDTVYRVGSVSKLFTVAAALQFAELGQLDLDAPVTRVLPEFRIGERFGKNLITARQLMTHHAGLPRDLLQGMWQQSPDRGFQSVLSYLATTEPAYPPGKVWSYSNLGLSILGAIIERLAGVPFDEHMQQALLAPLGMKTASFSSALANSPQHSKAYARKQEAFEPALRDLAAGGLNASVSDLARWLMMTFAQGQSEGRAVLRASSVGEMLRVQNQAVPLDFDLKVGMGWMLTPPPGRFYPDVGPIASHNGATINFRSLIVALPKTRLGVAILCNSANAGKLGELAETTLSLMLEAKTGQPSPNITPPPPWRKANSSEPSLATYPGTYVTPGGAVRVSLEDRELRAQLPGLRFSLVPDGEGFLHVEKKLFNLIPLPLGDLAEPGFRLKEIEGRRVLVAQRGATAMLFGERLNEQSDSLMHPSWREMLGTYAPDTSPGEFPLIERLTLFEADQQLNLRLALSQPLTDQTPGSLLVQTLSDRQAVIADKLDRYGEPLAIDVREGGKQLRFSGVSFRRLS